jgi:hypothetical protein
MSLKAITATTATARTTVSIDTAYHPRPMDLVHVGLRVSSRVDSPAGYHSSRSAICMQDVEE